MLFANYIFKPRSDLIFSVEYRRLRTYDVDGPAAAANQLGLAVGFLF
jgi:predicted porin